MYAQSINHIHIIIVSKFISQVFKKPIQFAVIEEIIANVLLDISK